MNGIDLTGGASTGAAPPAPDPEERNRVENLLHLAERLADWVIHPPLIHPPQWKSQQTARAHAFLEALSRYRNRELF